VYLWKTQMKFLGEG